MARLKIPVPNRRCLNVYTKSHGPISLSSLLQNQVEYAATNQKNLNRGQKIDKLQLILLVRLL